MTCEAFNGKPSPSHAGSRLRTHIPDEDEEDMLGEECDLQVKIHNDDDGSLQGGQNSASTRGTANHPEQDGQNVLFLREG